MYSRSVNFKPVAYDQILKADTEMNRVLAQTPEWMRDESSVLEPSWPWWVEWQRHAFMVRHDHCRLALVDSTELTRQISSSHKVRKVRVVGCMAG